MGVKINYFALIGFTTQLFYVIATVDADSDGKVTGPEKLAAARRAAQALLQNFPNFQGSMDPAKLDRIINGVVAILNEFIK